MYHSGVGGVSVGAGGVLAATGLWTAGYVWAAVALVVTGLVLTSLAVTREYFLRKRLRGRRVSSSCRPAGPHR
jgi:hypothetical protein